jgi:hypothetical protein
MKLSEAIALGRNNTKLNHTTWLSKNQECGCLLGIGFSATTRGHELAGIEYVGWDELDKQWPWISEFRQMPHSLLPRFFNIQDCSATDIISCLAEAVGCGHITFDQAIDWIRENEPQETQEEKREMVETFCADLVSK